MIALPPITKHIDIGKPKNKVTVDVYKKGTRVDRIEGYNQITSAYAPFFYGLRGIIGLPNSGGRKVSSSQILLIEKDYPATENTIDPDLLATVTNKSVTSLETKYTHWYFNDDLRSDGRSFGTSLQSKVADDEGVWSTQRLELSVDVVDTVYGVFITGTVGGGIKDVPASYESEQKVLCFFKFPSPIVGTLEEPYHLDISYECRASVPVPIDFPTYYYETIDSRSVIVTEYNSDGTLKGDGQTLSYTFKSMLVDVRNWDAIDVNNVVGISPPISPLLLYFESFGLTGQDVALPERIYPVTSFSDLTTKSSLYSCTSDFTHTPINIANTISEQEVSGIKGPTTLSTSGSGYSTINFGSPLKINSTQSAQITLPKITLTWSVE